MRKTHSIKIVHFTHRLTSVPKASIFSRRSRGNSICRVFVTQTAGRSSRSPEEDTYILCQTKDHPSASSIVRPFHAIKLTVVEALGARAEVQTLLAGRKSIYTLLCTTTSRQYPGLAQLLPEIILLRRDASQVPKHPPSPPTSPATSRRPPLTGTRYIVDLPFGLAGNRFVVHLTSEGARAPSSLYNVHLTAGDHFSSSLAGIISIV
ncbi:hypothetical protein D9611_010567 [Ephemerocybe angulata]|uniref:Uncharacterized protein n=1 Tax=Ephemerocybe angulata TaxID=980116 RepID=A0A8H5BVF9_9AGAR|nr:hypothetical protein D9611_010567 [Tulosesus angulatus]